MNHINQTIGNYRINRFINEGGLAFVYEGTELSTDTKVAIKVLKESYVHDSDQRERFKREGKLLATLNHPNIVKVLHTDDFNGCPVMIMEYLDGEDLKDYLSLNGALPIEIVESFFLQILEGINYAHSKGVFHRDIKPSNIYITEKKQIKILDFGIAKIIDGGTDRTRTGVAMGTPAFMSPEQVRGDKTVDGRSDIYSLGVTLFTMINGKHPYANTDSQFEIQSKVVNEKLPGLANETVLSKIVWKATEKDVKLRYQTIKELEAAFIERNKIKLDENKIEDKKTNKSLKYFAIFGIICVVAVSLMAVLEIGPFANTAGNEETGGGTVEAPYGGSDVATRNLKEEVQNSGEVKVGLINCEAIPDEILTNKLYRIFSKSKTYKAVSCSSTEDALNKINTKEVDIAIVPYPNDWNFNQSVVDVAEKDYLMKECNISEGSESTAYRIVIPKNNQEILNKLNK